MTPAISSLPIRVSTLLSAASTLLCALSIAWAQDVLTERYSNARTGSTTQSINSNSFLNGWDTSRSIQIDGAVYAQPLFVGDFPGQHPKLVFIATEHNQVSAWDADSLAQVWSRNLGPRDMNKTGNPGCDGIAPDGIGIEATPTIDRNLQRLFVSYRANRQGSISQELVALDLATGRSVAGPVKVTGPAKFSPEWQRSRASLLLQNGAVYVAFAARCEEEQDDPYYGFLFAFDENTLSQLGVFDVTNSGLFQGADNGVVGAGIWQASSGLAGDGSDVYFIAGNRRLWDNADVPNLGDSFVRLHPQPVNNSKALNFSVVDWFSPYRKVWLDLIDLDLGSAGPILIPGDKYLLGGGKLGWLYLLDRNNMGKVDSNAAKSWTLAKVLKIKSDATVDQFPEDLKADKVVQKFQVAFQQYIPNNPSYLGQPGSSLAVAAQNSNQLDVFNVGRDGAVYVTWQVPSGEWSDGMNGHSYPAKITPSITRAGASVAAANQGPNQVDTFVAGNDGAVYVTWVVGLGHWSDGTTGNPFPAPITPAGVMPAGGCLTTAMQGANQLDVFYVGNDGAVHVTWVVGGGHWSDGTPGNPPPAPITPPNFAVAGSCVAAGLQTANQLDVFAVNKNDGAVYVTLVVGLGHWSDSTPGNPPPARITPQRQVDPRATLAAAQQSANQLDVFYPGPDGALYVTWVVGLGHWSDGTPGNSPPAPITPQHVISPTGALSAAIQTSNQLDVFYLQTSGPNNGALMVTWVVGLGHWSDGTPGNPTPAATTPKNLLENPGQSVPSNLRAGLLQVFFLGEGGAIDDAQVFGVGHWTDGQGNDGLPQELGRALWMHHWPDWPQYPHIHGSPVFVQFKDGTSRMFIWPEKDHLKSFAWTGNQFDLQSKVLGVGQNGTLLVAPDGMPGGMLAATVDPSQAEGGIVFASLSQDMTTSGPGILRAFNAVTLKEVWNNSKDAYCFSKFVPPTIANGHVYLPTCSNKVLVYGP
jgi:hypothetical protein